MTKVMVALTRLGNYTLSLGVLRVSFIIIITIIIMLFW